MLMMKLPSGAGVRGVLNPLISISHLVNGSGCLIVFIADAGGSVHVVGSSRSNVISAKRPIESGLSGISGGPVIPWMIRATWVGTYCQTA